MHSGMPMAANNQSGRSSHSPGCSRGQTARRLSWRRPSRHVVPSLRTQMDNGVASMTDYADLVKRLRRMGACKQDDEMVDHYCPNCDRSISSTMLSEAADAIERTIQKLEEMEALGRAVYEDEPQGAVFLLDEDGDLVCEYTKPDGLVVRHWRATFDTNKLSKFVETTLANVFCEQAENKK